MLVNINITFRVREHDGICHPTFDDDSWSSSGEEAIFDVSAIKSPNNSFADLSNKSDNLERLVYEN